MFFKKKKNKGYENFMGTLDVEYVIFMMDNVKEVFWDREKVELGYTEESVKSIEKYAEELCKEYQDAEDKDQYGTIAIMFGLYIGKILSIHFGKGYFEQGNEMFGDNSYPFFIDVDEGNMALFPVEWVYKRIVCGETENISVKYKSFVDQVEEKLKNK